MGESGAARYRARLAHYAEVEEAERRRRKEAEELRRVERERREARRVELEERARAQEERARQRAEKKSAELIAQQERRQLAADRLRLRDERAVVDTTTRWEDDYACRYIVSRNPGGLLLEEVALYLGITRERVRQIEERALWKLARAAKHTPLGE